MPKSSDIVRAARTWVGTPYVNQHQMKGLGVSCSGLILGVGAETGALIIPPAAWKPFASLSRMPNPERMGLAMRTFLVPLAVPVADAAPDGSIGWFEWREGFPMHLAIMATFEGQRTMIHAADHAGACCENGFVPPWPARVHSWWRYPNVVD